MDRYADNGSPEPTQATSSTNTSTSSEELSLLSGCYKTPDTYQHYNAQFAQYNQMNPIGSFYPTPPSDSEDSSTLPAANIYQANHYAHIQSLTPLTSTTNLPHNYYNNTSSSSSSINDPNTSTSSSVNEEAVVNRQLYKEETTTEGKLPPSKEIELIFAPIDEPLDKKGRYKRRTRTCFSKYQLDVLEATFQKYNYPEIHVVDKLCDELNLKQERISIWFQNRRARSKKCKKQEAKESKENRCDTRPNKPPTPTIPAIPTSSTQYPSIPVSSRAPVTTTPAYPATTAYHNYNTFYTGLPTYQQSTPTIAASNSNYYSVPANYYQNQFYQYPAFYQAPNLDVYSQTNSATANYLQSCKKEEEATN